MVTSKNELVHTLMAVAGDKNVITVHRPIVKFVGSLEAALLLEQLLYWTPRSKNQGWVAKSDAEFGEEICLSRYGLRSARSRLEDMGLLETRLKRFNGAPTTHYRLNIEALNEQWIVWIQTMDCMDSDNRIYESEQSLTETTTETTTKESAPEKSDQAEVEQPAVEEPAVDKKQAYQDRLAHALALGMTRGFSVSVSHYPERVRGLVAAFCKEFNFKPPLANKHKRREYEQWVLDAEDFMAACDEVDPVSVLTRIRADFIEYMSTHNGLAPFRVLSIRSLVKSARQAAGELRGQAAPTEMPTSFYV